MIDKIIKERIKTLDETLKMEKDLKKYGQKIQSGYVMTVGDLLRYFENNTCKKQTRRNLWY